MRSERRLFLSLLALAPLLVQSSSIKEGNSLSPLALEIVGRERYLEDYDYYNHDESSVINEKCSEYLVRFLEGTTDAKDTCEGILNAYMAANCESLPYQDITDDQDDYFGVFYEHKCCQSLLNRYSDYCEEGTLLSNVHLVLVASVLLFCEVTKAIIKWYDVHFLPEAAVCILVGTFCGIIGHLIPWIDIDDLSFNEELFLSVLLPPIIFEAALSVSKTDFRRRRLAIFMFAVAGTILSTFMTGVGVHFASKALKNSTTIPILDCIIYGALISSIDPVAILSVLTSLNMSQTDTVFILIFGESLLNDGVAITISQSLSTRFGQGNVTVDDVFGDIADFLIVCFGSIFVGFACAILCMMYYWVFGKMLNPGMEVGSFFLWALIPYWICDGLEWSGIVSIVTMGFFMDVYVASPQETHPALSPTSTRQVQSLSPPAGLQQLDISSKYSKMEDEDTKSEMTYYSDGKKIIGRMRVASRLNVLRLLVHKDRIRLSEDADKHVRFVAHLLAQLAENAIFAYLGLFLLSRNYDWDFPLVTTSVIICILSRALMVIIICWVIMYINKLRLGVAGCGYEKDSNVSRTATHIQDWRTQLVLIFAGLRGAVSLALVENIPLYNNVTKEGCEFKPVLKAMTSASIIFTMFVFGGGAYYIFPFLGIKPDASKQPLSLSSVNSMTETYEIRIPSTPRQRRKNRLPRESEIEAEMYEMGAITMDSGDVISSDVTSDKGEMT